MAWYADLTPYTYTPVDEETEVRNVGWLERGQQYTSGPVGSPAVQRVFERRLVEAGKRWTGPVFAGVHQCDLCAEDSPMGTGEVQVWNESGSSMLAAPALVAHYVAVHHYRPPDEFVDALCAGRIETPRPYDAGDVVGRYSEDEPLDAAHAAIAATAIAALAHVPALVVANEIGFVLAYWLIRERTGGFDPDADCLPRMRVGLDRSGHRSFWTGDGYWDGTAASLIRIVQGSMSEYALQQLREIAGS